MVDRNEAVIASDLPTIITAVVPSNNNLRSHIKSSQHPISMSAISYILMIILSSFHDTHLIDMQIETIIKVHKLPIVLS